MKKILSLAISLAIVIGCFSGMSVSAKVFTKTYFNCDTLPDVLPSDGSTVTLDTTVKNEGSASLKVKTTDYNNFDLTIPCSAFDASGYGYLLFDFRCESGDVLRLGDLYYQFSEDDSKRVQDAALASGSKLINHYADIPANQWITISIPVSDLIAGGGEITNVDIFRLVNFSGLGGWIDVKDLISTGTSFWIDNVRFGNEYSKAGELLLSSCDVAYPGAWSTDEVSTDHASEGSTSLKVTLAANGTMLITQGVKQGDITGYEYLCFDVWSGNHDVLAKTTELFLRLDADDTHNYDVPRGMGATFTTVDGWSTVCLSTAAIASAGIDLAHIVRFQLFNGGGVWGNQAGCTFYIDNIRATHEKPDFRYGGDGFCTPWVNVSVSSDSTLASDGDSSTKITITDDGLMGFYYYFDTVGYNVDDYKYLKFDVYSSNPVIFAARNNVMLRMNGLDVPQFDASPYLCGPSNIITANEWHTYCIPTSALRSAGVNLQSVVSLFLFNDGGQSESLAGQSFNIDNIRFSMTNAAGDCEHSAADKVVIGAKAPTLFASGETGETWCKITGTRVADNSKLFAYGDLNGDDAVNIIDLVRLETYYITPATVIAAGTGDIDADSSAGTLIDVQALRVALLS